MKTVLITFLIVLLAACAGGVEPTVGSMSSTSAAPISESYDLTNPSVAARLGSPEFSPVNWQRLVGPWTAVGDGALPDPDELALMQAAALDLPAVLGVTPRKIVRTATVAIPAGHPATGAVAVSKGPDIYLLDGVFAGTRQAPRLDILRALSHELVHVAQWYELSDSYVAATLDGRVSSLRLVDGSALVADWATATGWTDTDPDPLTADWNLDPSARPPTAYAATDPAEDMAESISLAVVGRGAELDDARRAWVESWVGADLDTLAAGQPWTPAGAVPVSSEAPIYDTAAVGDLAGDRLHADQLAFELPGNLTDLDEVASLVLDGLARHGMTGVLDGDDVLRSGEFDRADGSTWWVEIRDARSNGAAGLLLVYVLVW